MRALSDFSGEWLVLFFIKDPNTHGAVRQTFAFKELFKEFAKLKTRILGISNHTREENKRLTQRVELPYGICSDSSREVVKAFGVWTPKTGKQGRWDGVSPSSVLVDPKGKVVKVWPRIHQMGPHAARVLEARREAGA